MKISTLRKISKEDLAKFGEELPEWIDALLGPINELLDQFSTAMRQGVSARQNLLCSVLDLKLTHGVETDINTQKTGKILGVIPLAVQGDNATIEQVSAFGFRITGTRSIKVKIDFASGSGQKQCKLLVWFDEE